MSWLADESHTGWIGLDVGGANLKTADGLGRAESLPFALWRDPDGLADAVASLLDRFPPGPIALTMTGELADCFATKADGVRVIVETVRSLAPTMVVATTDDRWLLADAAIAEPIRVAAANWRLGARLVAKQTRTEALWIDAGSTTIDVIPVDDGRVRNNAATDTHRLLAGELLYTGVRRTPVCAVVPKLPYRGNDCPVAAELFATTADVWLLLGHLPEDADAVGADGRPMTRSHGVTRLGRCVAADATEWTDDDALRAAQAIADAQVAAVADAIGRFGPLREQVFVSGEGAFLVRLAIERLGRASDTIELTDVATPAASACWPAHAAAVLAPAECADESGRDGPATQEARS